MEEVENKIDFCFVKLFEFFDFELKNDDNK